MRKIILIFSLFFLYSCTTGEKLISSGKIQKGLSKKDMRGKFMSSTLSEDPFLLEGGRLYFSDTKTEIITETDIATAISLNNCPIGRSTIKTGIKTTTVVRAEPKIGFHTCNAPFNEAFLELAPNWLSL